MKLRKAEWISIAVTGLFLLGLAGYQIHVRHGNNTVSIMPASDIVSMESEQSTTLNQTASDTETVEPDAEEQNTMKSDAMSSDVATSAEGLVDLNTADAEQLKQLPGIGDVLAERIIAYREEHGGFSSIEEIMNVKGIAGGRFAEIKDKICVTEG
ncbi:MAG: ComEA family DNA-binding protein [Oscillospiraceae bacterium]